MHTWVQLCLWILDNGAGDARHVCSGIDAAKQLIMKFHEVFIPSFTKPLCVRAVSRPKPQNGNIVLPVIGNATKDAHFSLHVDDFAYFPVLYVSLQPEAVVDSETHIKGQSLEVVDGIDVTGLGTIK